MDFDLDAVLPAPLSRLPGPPPPPPEDFEDKYVLPEHYEKPLQTLNSDALASRLVFYEKPHVYTFDGVPTSISVTAVAHAYETPFVPTDAIAGMKRSKQAWPRQEYVLDLREWSTPHDDASWDVTRGLLKVVAGKTVSVVHPRTMREGCTVDELQAMLVLADVRKDPCGDEDDVTLYSFERGLTDGEIMALWEKNGQIASHKGTEAHYLAECFFNGIPFRWWEPDMQVLYDFVREHLLPRGIVAFQTEKEIVCQDADVAGSIDLIVFDASTGLHHIIDHKRSDKLRLNLRGFRRMKAPLNHLADCKGAAYALQTSIYQYILEREYGLSIGERILLSLHPDQPFCTAVPYLKAETEFLMQSRFALVRARKKVAALHPERFRCALTGAPLVDAVRLADGRVAMEKAALVAQEEEGTPSPFTVDDELRAEFEAAVARVCETVTLDKKACVPWDKRMPECGMVPFAPP